MKALYITSTETFSGKSSLCVGLGRRFQQDGFTIGYGTAGGKLDLAFMYLDSGERVTTTNRDNFNGRYSTDALLFGVTYNW